MSALERIEGRRLHTKSIAEPLETNECEVHARKAVKGSRRLRNAVWKLQGYKPPKIVKVALCSECHGPIAPRLLVAEIQQLVGSFYGYSRNHLLGDRRDRELTNARQVAMYLSSELTSHSIAEIGRRFKRDHTTILHAMKVIPHRAETNEELALHITLLRERLGA